MPDPSDRPSEGNLLAEIGAHINSGDPDSAYELLRPALEFATTPAARAALRSLHGDCSFVYGRPIEAQLVYADAINELVDTEDAPSEVELAVRSFLEARRAIAICVAPPGTLETTMAMLNVQIANIVNYTRSGLLNPVLADIYFAQSIVARRLGSNEDPMFYLDNALAACSATDDQLRLKIHVARAAALISSGNEVGITEELRACDDILAQHDRGNKWRRQRALVAMLTADFADTVLQDNLMRGIAAFEAADFRHLMSDQVRLGLDMEYTLLSGRRAPDVTTRRP